MAITDNKIINGSGLSELSSQIKSYVNGKIVNEVYVGDTAPTDPKAKLWVDTSAEPSNNSYTKSEIDTKLTQKQDTLTPGDNITIVNGVISSTASGSAEPDAYIKDASISGDTLTLTKKDNTEIVFTPSGGSSGGSGGYHFEVDTTLTDEDKTHIIEIWNNKNIPMFIGNKTVIRKFAVGATKYFCVINLNNTENKVLIYTIQTDALNTSVLSDKFTLTLSYDLVSNTDGGNILTSNNWQNYISVVSSGDWNYTNDIWDSNLYNAKELIFVMGNSSSGIVNSVQGYYNFSKDSAGGETTLGGSFTNCRYSLKTERDNIYWEYTGSVMNVYNNSESYYFLYKT